MTDRYSFGGDEHVFVEVDEEMSLRGLLQEPVDDQRRARLARSRASPRSARPTPRSRSSSIPDRDQPRRHAGRAEAAWRRRAEKAESRAQDADHRDPGLLPRSRGRTETLMRFRERHQDPKATDIEYAARINNLDGVDGFIKAHSGSPWFVSMVGFVAGLPFLYQMVDRKRQIEVPKYLRPRTDTPKLTVGLRRLLRLHLFGARRRRLPDVRHHADADLRPQPGDQLSARLHGASSGPATS